MKIIIDSKIPFIKGRIETAASHAGTDVEVLYVDPADITRDAVRDATALIIRTRTRCDAALLEGSGVRLVVTATIGTDHIDLQWCADNGIKVRNAAGCNAPGVAQYVWSALLRHGFTIPGSTIGVVGAGNVGSIVAEWGKRLGARVLVCDPPRQRAGHADHDYVSLREVLSESDAVTIHTPLTNEGLDPTYHLVGEEELDAMRHGAILINTSRGPVVDNEAWSRHIAAGKGRAIVDVWEGEPAISRRLLAGAMIATPHIAGYSFEGKQRATRMALRAAGECLGLDIPLDGLCGDYVSPGDSLTAETAGIIVDSYDPGVDDAALRADPASFERLRGDYDYRHEPFIRQ